MREFLAEGDAQVQKGVSGEREDPKTREASEKLYGVCDENTAAGGEARVSPSTGYVSLQQMHQKGRMCKKQGYKSLGHSPQGVAGGCLGLLGVCSHPSSKEFPGSIFASSAHNLPALLQGVWRTVPTADALPGWAP